LIHVSPRWRQTILRLLLVLSLLAVLGVITATVAWAQQDPTSGTALVAQEQPYRPGVTEIEPPNWLAPLGPLASLPVWAIAAILAAAAAAIFVVVPTVVKWIWVLRSTRDSES
jgi:hypothetical protein